MKTSGQQAFKIAQNKETEQEKLQERAQMVFERLVNVLDQKVRDENYKPKEYRFKRRDHNVEYEEWEIALEMLKNAAKADGYDVASMRLESNPVQLVLTISWDLSKKNVDDA